MSPKARSSRSGRYYIGPGGRERFWAVTTILDALPKSALKWWAAGVTAEVAVDETKNWLGMNRADAIDWLKRAHVRKTSHASEIGSAIHKMAQDYILGRPTRADVDIEEVRQATAHFLDFLDKMRPKYVMTEATVFNRAQRFAGTLDAILELDSEVLELIGDPWAGDYPEGGPCRLLIDYKTGGSIEDDKGVYPESALQLNAYANGEFIGAKDGSEQPLPEVHGLAVVHVTPDGWELVPVRMGEDVFTAFLYVREVKRWLDDTSKTVLGRAVTLMDEELPA